MIINTYMRSILLLQIMLQVSVIIMGMAVVFIVLSAISKIRIQNLSIVPLPITILKVKTGMEEDFTRIAIVSLD